MKQLIVDVTEQNFDAEVTQSKIPVLVDFWAPWCSPCKMLAPMIDEIALEKEGSLKVVKINIDEASELAVKHSVRGIPTLMVFENGELKAAKVGALTRNNLNDFLASSLV